VMNGTGVTNQATDTANALSQLGFHIVGEGDVNQVAAQSETVVYSSSKSAKVLAAAQKVARSMTGSVILGYAPSQVADGAEVTVVTGSNFVVNASHASSTSSTSAATATTAPSVTTTTSSTSGDFSSPTSSNEALAPWDPRACTASGGEGS
jgi:LytR cell envelope-related transcriptional attenuator